MRVTTVIARTENHLNMTMLGDEGKPPPDAKFN